MEVEGPVRFPLGASEPLSAGRPSPETEPSAQYHLLAGKKMETKLNSIKNTSLIHKNYTMPVDTV